MNIKTIYTIETKLTLKEDGKELAHDLEFFASKELQEKFFKKYVKNYSSLYPTIEWIDEDKTIVALGNDKVEMVIRTNFAPLFEENE